LIVIVAAVVDSGFEISMEHHITLTTGSLLRICPQERDGSS